MTLLAVIFDLDGLVIDSEPLQQRAFNELLVRHGITYQIGDEEYGKYFVGVSVEDNAKWLTSRLGMESSADQIRVDQDAIYTRLIQDSGNLIATDGLYDLLNYLESRGLWCGIATGSPRHQVEIILRGLKIESCFRAIVTGSEITNPKPDPEVYLRIVQTLGVDAKRAVALEDSAAGIASARAAGLYAIAVPNRYTRHQDLTHADAILENLTQIIGWIEKTRG